MRKYSSMDDRYLKAIKEGIAEYKQLSGQRKTLDARMQKVLQLIAANVNMLPDAQQEAFISQLMEMTPPSGLRDAVLRTLPDEGWMSPTEVRDRLVESGYDFAGQANPLASIHTTLKRLVDATDAVSNTPQPDGKTYYQRSAQAKGIANLSMLAELMGVTTNLGYLQRALSEKAQKARQIAKIKGKDDPKFYGR